MGKSYGIQWIWGLNPGGNDVIPTHVKLELYHGRQVGLFGKLGPGGLLPTQKVKLQFASEDFSLIGRGVESLLAFATKLQFDFEDLVVRVEKNNRDALHIDSVSVTPRLRGGV